MEDPLVCDLWSLCSLLLSLAPDGRTKPAPFSTQGVTPSKMLPVATCQAVDGGKRLKYLH